MQLTKLNVIEAATSLGVSKSWLDKTRVYGGGPEYHKFGRRVLYDVNDLQNWATRNKRRHTSEPAPHAPVVAFAKAASDPESKK
ncbi:DNA-binding protein [Bradyrhizobium sp.]|uniref:helix-turn-helix transcriptional regulator n=1 Tax=Bradyrhizobium sp. TaxID=376 RepID=UPI0025C2BBDC|nr:DNA-binding protein [Bradyrhizobium sp.]